MKNLNNISELQNQFSKGNKFGLVDEVEAKIIEFAKERGSLKEKDGYFIVDIESQINFLEQSAFNK